MKACTSDETIPKMEKLFVSTPNAECKMNHELVGLLASTGSAAASWGSTTCPDPRAPLSMATLPGP